MSTLSGTGRSSHASKELGAFLRARRSELQPEDVGLVRTGRRRVTGLRRDEVATLASVSDSWYTWLEQGRDVHPTPQVLDALSKALRLSPDSREYLYRLARAAHPVLLDSNLEIRPVVGLIEDVLPSPALVMDYARDVIAWNTSVVALFGEIAGGADDPPNVFRLLLGNERFKSTFVDWQDAAEEAIARFRAAQASYPQDERITSLIADLNSSSPLFRRVWSQHIVRPPRSNVQALQHKHVGVMQFEVLQLFPAGDPLVTLVIYRPADAASSEKLAQLTRN